MDGSNGNSFSNRKKKRESGWTKKSAKKGKLSQFARKDILEKRNLKSQAAVDPAVRTEPALSPPVAEKPATTVSGNDSWHNSWHRSNSEIARELEIARRFT